MICKAKKAFFNQFNTADKTLLWKTIKYLWQEQSTFPVLSMMACLRTMIRTRQTSSSRHRRRAHDDLRKIVEHKDNVKSSYPEGSFQLSISLYILVHVLVHLLFPPCEELSPVGPALKVILTILLSTRLSAYHTVVINRSIVHLYVNCILVAPGEVKVELNIKTNTLTIFPISQYV